MEAAEKRQGKRRADAAQVPWIRGPMMSYKETFVSAGQKSKVCRRARIVGEARGSIAPRCIFTNSEAHTVFRCVMKARLGLPNPP